MKSVLKFTVQFPISHWVASREEIAKETEAWLKFILLTAPPSANIEPEKIEVVREEAP